MLPRLAGTVNFDGSWLGTSISFEEALVNYWPLTPDHEQLSSNQLHYFLVCQNSRRLLGPVIDPVDSIIARFNSSLLEPVDDI